MEKEKIIEVKNLMASFDGNVILSDVTFNAYRGEVTAILGPSGCGKSTVLRHLLGLQPIQKGRISVFGNDIQMVTEANLLALYLQMGVFYQNGALLNSMTVGENVSLPLEQHSNLPKSLIKDIVYMKLGLVNLKHAYHLYPAELSGGMLKRAALARAIIMDPPLLLCDEPGAGLDPISLKSLDELIIDLKEQLGMSVILVTHEVSSIMRIADRIIYLSDKTVAFEGILDDALTCDNHSIKSFFSLMDASRQD